MSYAGFFTKEYREKIKKEVWFPKLSELEFKHDRNYNFVDFMIKDLEKQKWIENELPSDE